MFAAIIALSALTLACVSVQNSGGPGNQPKTQPSSGQQNDSGFTVSETTVPTTPQAPGSSNDGFTVGETAVPDK
jgi:hypothetical protein